MKDYAKAAGVTYEAVRQSVKRYSTELEGHIHQEGRTQFLDDEAVKFLDEHRNRNPVVIIQQDKDEQIEQLRQEKEALLVKVAAQGARIAELADWKADNALLIAGAEQTRLALEEAKAEQKAQAEEYAQGLAQAAQEAAEAARAAQEAQEQAEAEKKAREAAEAELQAYKALPWYKKIFK